MRQSTPAVAGRLDVVRRRSVLEDVFAVVADGRVDQQGLDGLPLFDLRRLVLHAQRYLWRLRPALAGGRSTLAQWRGSVHLMSSTRWSTAGRSSSTRKASS